MLDQGQTITVASTPRVLNLIKHDNLMTTREWKSSTTREAMRLLIDHQEAAKVKGYSAATAAGTFNKMQLASDVVVSGNTVEPICITVSIQAGANVPLTVVEEHLDAFLAFVPTVQARVLANES